MRGSNPAALGLLLYEARGTVKTLTAASVELAERAEFQWICARKNWAAPPRILTARDRRTIRKLSAHNTTGALYGSCRRAIRPARYTKAAGAQYDRRAIRKLPAHNTTGGANKNRATRGSATGGASKNRATRGSATGRPAVFTQQVRFRGSQRC